MRITKAEQAVRKDRMLHTAYTLFSRHGIDEVSLAKIAVEAGVSPNSIFRYFDSKTVLLQQTQDILWREIVDCITKSNQPAVQAAPNGLEEIRVRLHGFQDLYQNHRGYIMFAYEYQAYLVRNSIRLDGRLQAKSTHHIRQIFMHAFRRGQKDGSIATTRPPKVLFTFIWGIMRHYVEQLAVYGHIYTGPNPWETTFPFIVTMIIDELSKDDVSQKLFYF